MDHKDYSVFLEQVKLETQSMWITDLFVDNPCKPICACYVFLILCLMVSGAAGYMKPTLGSDRDYAIWMDPIQVNEDIRTLARADIKESLGTGVIDTQTEKEANIFVLYE